MIDDELLDDLFHGCAAAAYIEVSRRQRGAPCEETTRQRAYELYEQALADRPATKLRPAVSKPDAADSSAGAQSEPPPPAAHDNRWRHRVN